jgi:hypothetical protein
LVNGRDVVFQSPLGGALLTMALVAVCRWLGVECVFTGSGRPFGTGTRSTATWRRESQRGQRGKSALAVRDQASDGDQERMT